MLKYVNIVDTKTGMCDVGLGSLDSYYDSIGMEIKDVEEAFDGKWYLKEKLLTDDYKEKLANFRKQNFEKEFFETSLGWIKRKVLIKDGYWKDFSDFLPQLKLALDMGKEVEIPVYQMPDFSLDEVEIVKEIKKINSDFLCECLDKTFEDI